MTQTLDRASIFGTRPSDTGVSPEAFLALRTRGRRPDSRLARRLLTELEELAFVIDETLASNNTACDELFGLTPVPIPSRDLTSAGGPSALGKATAAVPPEATIRAMAALKVLMDTLTISETEAATVAGISRNTIRGWKEGRAPYPATTRRLFQVANLFEAIERAGVRVADWIDQAASGGRVRRDLLHEDDGPIVLASEAAKVVFANPPIQRIAEELQEDDEQSHDARNGEPQQFTFNASRRRRKKP